MTIVPRRLAHGVALIGGLLFVVGTGSSIALRKIYDTRPAQVHIRWAPSADDEGRERLEQQFGLTTGEPLDDRTWGYYLVDLSRANIEAIVRHPMVEDTQDIHRQAFRVGLRATRAPDVPPDPDIPRTYVLIARFVLAVGALAIGVAWIEGRLPASLRQRLFPGGA